MGGGTYCSVSRSVRSEELGYDRKPAYQIFTNKSINNAMNPHGISVRESRDSDEHPNSLAIIIALDVTGSMGSVPHHLVKEGLPKIMEGILNSGFPDPQVLFLAIGDHECDSSPLQVGQFESNDEMLDKWLTDVYLEGGGGGNLGESYALAWYFAANHTSIDCMEKRGIKGLLFTIGDEPNLKYYPKKSFQNIMGSGQFGDMTSNELYEAARKSYEVFHIHVSETGAGSKKETLNEWKQLLADNVIPVQKHQDVSATITNEVIKHISKSSIKTIETTAEKEQTKIML